MKTYAPTTQCNSKTTDYEIFKLSASDSNLCPQRKSPLINRWMLDQTSPQLIDILHKLIGPLS